ncbi:MAG: hypothetical protein QGG23_06610 [Candidatus Bathyarchaeota archaeon]|jgi:hypothetical protein|nr:hypothetical protein [Candidatus Bathyarchaeota archaeon]
MVSGKSIRCVLTDRELQVIVILGVVNYMVFRNIHHINVWRLTPAHVPRQFFIYLEPGSIIAIIGSCLAGPIAGMAFGLVAWNPVIIPEVLIVVKIAQFVSIGYLHKKIQPPYNIFAIPVGTIITLIVHPTIVGYVLFKKLFIHLYWFQNIAFQTVVAFLGYIVLRLMTPKLFSWVNPKHDYTLKIPYLTKKSKKD